MNYRFKRFTYMTDREWIVFIPTIMLHLNDLIYGVKNFGISLHWLCWHCKWTWVRKEFFD